MNWNCKEHFLDLFETELERTKFGNDKDEDDSYQFIISQMEIYFNDKKQNDDSITREDYKDIVYVLDNTELLENAYNKILNLLGE